VTSADPSNNCFCGTLNDGGYNVADDSSCNFTSGSGSTVISPTSAIGLDPSGLGMNGGPTATIALETNGQANTFIPAVSCTDQLGAPLTTDERGYTRPMSGTCSAGAYQDLGTPPFIIDCSKAVASNPNLVRCYRFVTSSR
jgi:hypothetical protein